MGEKRKRRPQVLLHSNRCADRWGDGYEDCIYLRKMGDDSLKMVAIKFFQGRKHLLDAVAGIRTAKRFDKAFSRIGGVVDNDGYTDELVQAVAKLDPVLAERIKDKLLMEEGLTDESAGNPDGGK